MRRALMGEDCTTVPGQVAGAARQAADAEIREGRARADGQWGGRHGRSREVAGSASEAVDVEIAERRRGCHGNGLGWGSAEC